ncbi:MAG TPA: AAA family ATPase, partial [Prosthecobacter sp.]|nr:AAA family ATPase [Prosthecobacter sp.]
MRLLAVRLQNLNSLSGRSHEVRFDAPPLSQAGVFLITGPTGAGKSTLLDAITLALYGRAARYGNDKADEMMSRHTAECQAEVDFEAGGKRLRATWRLRRARGRAEGALQPVERRLSRADTGEILAERSREIDQMVEQLTGLDCQRFLRSVLLAQGQFAAFLKAKPNERAELLEKITGTGIYSELSILAYRTYDEKQKEVTRLKDRLGCLAIMPDEERAEVEKQLSQSQSAISGLQSEHTAALKRFNDLKLLQQHQHDHAAVSGEIERLNETLQSLARQQAAAVAMVQQAQAKTEAARNARAAREPVWDQAAQLTAKWQAFEAQLTESRDTYRKHFAEHKAATTLQAEKEKLLVEHDRSAAALNDWLMQHAEDAALAAQITQLRAALPEWRKAHLALQEGKRLHGEKQALIQKQAGHQAAEKLLAAQLRDLRQGLVANHADLTRITAACDQQRKVVEHAQTVAGFEEHRLDLKAGEACPLCGATEHPFATDSVNFISQLQSSRQLLHSLEQQRDKMQRATAGAEQEVARAEARLDAELKWLAEVVENLRQMRAPDDAALVHLQTEEARRRLTIAATPDDAERVVAGLERR